MAYVPAKRLTQKEVQNAKDLLGMFQKKVLQAAPEPPARLSSTSDLISIPEKKVKKKISPRVVPTTWYMRMYESQKKNAMELKSMESTTPYHQTLSDLNLYMRMDCKVVYDWVHDPESKSILLSGNPGVGKTYFTRALRHPFLEFLEVENFNSVEDLFQNLYTRSKENYKTRFIVDDFDTLLFRVREERDLPEIPKDVRVMFVVTMRRHPLVVKLSKNVDIKFHLNPLSDFPHISKHVLEMTNGDIRSAMLSAGKKDMNDTIFSIVKWLHAKMRTYGIKIVDVWLELEPHLRDQYFYFLYKDPELSFRALEAMHESSQDKWISFMRLAGLPKPSTAFEYDKPLSSFSYRVKTEAPIRNRRFSWKHFMNQSYLAK